MHYRVWLCMDPRDPNLGANLDGKISTGLFP